MGTTLDRFLGGPLLSPRSLLDDFFGPGFLNAMMEPRAYRNLLPQATVKQDDGGATLEVGLPGFSPEEVDVSVENNTLFINAERKGQRENDEEGATVWERSYQRAVTLPDGVDEEGISASFENGLLAVRIPRLTEEQKVANRRRISIKQGSPEIEGTAGGGKESDNQEKKEEDS